MVSRAIVVNMEKGKPAERTLTDLFFAEGAKFRAWLKKYSETFEPNTPHEGDVPIYDPAIEKLIQEGKIDRREPDLFPPFDFSCFEDGRVREKAETLIPFAPVGEPRDMILSFCGDMERKQAANENTSFLVEYLQAYLKASKFKDTNGIVGTLQIRTELARMRGLMKTRRVKDGENGYVSYEEPDPNAKGMPSSRFVTKCMETLGFERGRMTDGNNGFLSNAELEKRLTTRYGLAEDSNDSDHSAHS
jgi:hypothetical protein